MGYRKFTDRDGRTWEVRDATQREWEFRPVGGNPGSKRTVASPGYEKDPFELSESELQRMLDGPGSARTRTKKSPFLD